MCSLNSLLHAVLLNDQKRYIPTFHHFNCVLNNIVQHKQTQRTFAEPNISKFTKMLYIYVLIASSLFIHTTLKRRVPTSHRKIIRAQYLLIITRNTFSNSLILLLFPLNVNIVCAVNKNYNIVCILYIAGYKIINHNSVVCFLHELVKILILQLPLIFGNILSKLRG